MYILASIAIQVAGNSGGLVDLIPEGVSVTGVLIVVWWTLRAQEKSDKVRSEESAKTMSRIEEITETCHKHAEEQQTRYSEMLDLAFRLHEANTKTILEAHKSTGNGIIKQLEGLKDVIVARDAKSGDK